MQSPATGHSRIHSRLPATSFAPVNHEYITSVMTSQAEYGVGVTPNPFSSQQSEWNRRKQHAEVLSIITEKIESLFEPRFITPPETSELIESIVRASDSRKILEIGTHTGFTSLHILRAIYGKQDAQLVSIDARPSHDRSFWQRKEFLRHIRFIEGWTPESITWLKGHMFDLVFVDSDHSVEHTQKELEALWPLTRKGTLFLFHDVPEWQSPDNHTEPPVRLHLWDYVRRGVFQGGIVPTCEQLDCRDVWGAGYPKECNPHLGIFVRRI